MYTSTPLHADGALFYVPFTVVDRLPVFVSEAACKIVAESLNFCHAEKLAVFIGRTLAEW
jgi:hypothetical protein